MPTRKEREYYRMGYADGLKDAQRDIGRDFGQTFPGGSVATVFDKPKKRKLSEWQKFVKANSKKPRFRYKSGRKKGMINLKALGVAYRKKKRR